MHYTLHQLHIFLKIVEKESITKAANELYLTQPAVSIQLKKLQDQFDVPLIEVIGRKVYITEFGQEIAAASRKIIDEVEQIRNKTLAYKGLLSGQLKISVVSTGKYVMPYFLGDFLSQHPGIDLKMDVTNKSSVVQNLEKNEIDFALVSVLPKQLSIEKIQLMENKLYLIRKFEPENTSKSIRTKTLAKLPLIFREKGSATRRAMEQYIESIAIPRRKSLELTSNEAVKQAVMAGLGLSVMPLIGIRNELLNQQLEVVSIKGLPITTHWNLIWLKEKKLSPSSLAYLNYIKEHKSDLIHTNFLWYEKYLMTE